MTQFTESNLNCDTTYVEEMGRTLSEHVINHFGRDELRAEKTRHENVNIDHFEILLNDYKNNDFKKETCGGTTY